jgi:hypothetical protein
MGAIVSSVRDAAGHPVPGALVVAAGPVTREATTSSAGIVTLLGLPSGRYSVGVTRAGYTPSSQTVSVVASETFKAVPVVVSAQTFSNAGGDFSATLSAQPGGGNAPFVGPAVANTLSSNILPTSVSASPFGAASPALEGTRPDETRVEIDGIPLAGPQTSATTLQLRSALDLESVTLVEGPNLSTASLQNAIGGIVAYRSPAITQTISSAYDLGYDSSFGSFEHVRFSDTFGKLGVSLDAVNGQSGDDAATLRAQLNLSSATSLAFASYQARADFVDGGYTAVNDAPAYAADARTSIAGGTLQGRVFESRSDTLVTPDQDAFASEAWRTNGFSAEYDLPFGQNQATIGYDRRVERASFDNAADVLEAVDTLKLAGGFQLSRTARLDAGDDLSTGTMLRHRNDPTLVLAIRSGNGVAFRLAAGSAYETPPETLLAAATPGLLFAPETSFGYRAGAEITTHSNDRIRIAAFELRTYDDFAELAQARSDGVELAFTRQALPGRLGVDAGVDFTRTYAFGAQQPLGRYDETQLVSDGEQIAGNPFTKARLALTYLDATTEFGFGTTLLGANNAFSDHALALGDLSMRLALAQLGYLRIGMENLFGQTILDPELAPLYPPHEVTLTLERK